MPETPGLHIQQTEVCKQAVRRTQTCYLSSKESCSLHHHDSLRTEIATEDKSSPHLQNALLKSAVCCVLCGCFRLHTWDSEFWLAAVCVEPGHLWADIQQGIQQQPAKGGLPGPFAPTHGCCVAWPLSPVLASCMAALIPEAACMDILKASHTVRSACVASSSLPQTNI